MSPRGPDQDRKGVLEPFFNGLAEAPTSALLLDYDGTLAPFHPDRNRAFPYPGVRERLNDLLHSGYTRLVIVSGRSIAQLPPLLGLDSLPEIWGSHGLERLRCDGTLQHAVISEAQQGALDEAARVLEGDGLAGHRELKPGCVALHWRGLEEAEGEALRRRIEPIWMDLARKGDLSLKGFDGGLEIRLGHGDKGGAVAAVLEEMEESAAAAYLGDDETDEDAFAALGRHRERHGSLGLNVLVRPISRTTLADVWIRPPEGLISFLDQWRAATQGDLT
jgi:trehalose 6-phosphate phosphatase